MITATRIALVLSLGLTVLSVACDRSQDRAAEEEALRRKPAVETGSIGQAMRAERAMPRMPTPDERLVLAIREGDRKQVERRIAEGAKLDSSAPLLVAAVRGKGDLGFLAWLVGKGAGIDVPDAAGRTPLSWAAGQGSSEQVAYLLKQGASVSSVDRLGRTPLHYGVFGSSPGVVVMLLEAQANIDAQDSLGATALMYACAKNQPAIVQTLRDRGADPRLEDKLGRTARQRAHGEDNPCAN